MLTFMKVLTQKKYHEHVPCSYAFKVVCIDDRFSKSIGQIVECLFKN